MTFYENIFSFFHLLVDRNKIYHFLFNFLKILIQCHDANWDYQKLAISIFKAIFFFTLRSHFSHYFWMGNSIVLKNKHLCQDFEI